MEENMERRRLSAGQKVALAVCGSIAALIVLVYLGLCIYVGGSHAVLPGVWACGVELGGMPREEVAPTMDAWVKQAYADAEYDLRCADSVVRLSGNLVYLDSAAVAWDAYMVGRSEPFLKRGAVILSHLVGGKTEISCPMVLNDAGKTQLEQALEQLNGAEGVPLVETVWAVAGDQLVITRGTTGVSVDEERALAVLEAAIQQPGRHTVEIPMRRSEPVPLDLQQVHREIYAQAADAYVERDEAGAVRIVPHVVGIDFDAAQAQKQFDAAKDGEVVTVPLAVTVPEMTQARMQGLLFADVLGECTTSIGGTEFRLNNVVVAAKAMDGKILMPGEVFSYNDTLGPRTVANGYQPAPAYIGGKTVDEVGGGICQNSSTLYLAALRANLEIVERTNHMYTVGYVPDGLDATVAYNALDYKFRNNTEHPIRMEVKVNGRKLTIRLYGTDTEHVTVKMVTETLSTTPYKVTYKPDDTVAVGKTVVDTTAYTGCKVRVFRCVYDADGNLLSRTQESMNNYRHRDKVILYNPADAEKLGLMDENGVVHTTVQPKKPEPVTPEPTPEPEQIQPEQPAPDVPVAAPQPEVEEQPQVEQPAQEEVPVEGV